MQQLSASRRMSSWQVQWSQLYNSLCPLTVTCDDQSMQRMHGHHHDGLSNCMSSMPEQINSALMHSVLR